jgi:hypothetical protein
VLVVQTAALWALRVPWGLQAAVLATIAWATAAGAGLLRGVTAGIGDVGARFAIWFLSGMATITGVSYVLFHPTVARALGLDSPAAATALSLTLVGLAALIVGLSRRPRPATATSGVGTGSAAALVLALALSGATVYGVANTTTEGLFYTDGGSILEALDPEHPLVGSTLPEWGYPWDYYSHLVEQPVRIYREGLPTEPVQHHGLQVWLLSSSLGFNGFDVADPVQAAKVLAVPVWFSLLALAGFVAHRVLGLGSLASVAAVASVALFGAIFYPFHEGSRSSYLGFISSSGAMYHNAPQLYSVAMGMAAAALVGLSAKQDRARGDRFVAAAAFVAASFWFKPALFVVFAPALLLAAVLAGKEQRRTAIATGAVLVLPVLWWVGYPRLIGVPTLGLGLEVEPLGFQFLWAADRFPSWISSSPWRLGAAIVLLSFAAWVIPVLAWLRRAGASFRQRGWAALGTVRYSPLQVMVAAALVLGLGATGLLVEEGDRFSHGNLTWPVAAAYVVAMPLLVRLAADLRSRVARLVVAVLLALHLAAGGVHLWLFITAGQL